MNKQATAETVQRNGTMLVLNTNEHGRYQAYKYKGKYYEVEKERGEVVSFTEYGTKPRYLDTLISSKHNELTQTIANA